MKLTEEELNIRLAIVTNQRNSALDEIVCLAAKIHILEKYQLFGETEQVEATPKRSSKA